MELCGIFVGVWNRCVKYEMEEKKKRKRVLLNIFKNMAQVEEGLSKRGGYKNYILGDR
jgi:hypothetical protein